MKITENNNHASAAAAAIITADVSTGVAKSLPPTNPFTDAPENDESIEDTVDSNEIDVTKNINNNSCNNNKNTNNHKTDEPDHTNDNHKHEVISYIIYLLCIIIY